MEEDGGLKAPSEQNEESDFVIIQQESLTLYCTAAALLDSFTGYRIWDWHLKRSVDGVWMLMKRVEK